MQDLGELLSPGQGTIQGQPTGTPSGGSVRPTGVPDPGMEQRKQGWKQALDSLVADPVSAMMLMQFGTSLANVQPGQGAGAQVSNAFSEAFSARGRYEQILRDRQAAEQEAQMKQERFALDSRRVDFEGDRLGLSREELAQRGRDAEADRGLEERRLGLEGRRVRVLEDEAKRKVEQPGAALSETDKLTMALVEAEGMTEARARILANEMDKKQTRQDRIASVATSMMELDTTFTLQMPEAMAQAAELVDKYSLEGGQAPAGGEGQAQTQGQNLDAHPGWSGVAPEKKAQIMDMVRAGKYSEADVAGWLTERAGK